MDKNERNLLQINDFITERMMRKLPIPGSEHVKLKIGTIYCDDYEPTHRHVATAIWDYLKGYTKVSTIYMFRQGPIGLMNSEYSELNPHSRFGLNPYLVPEYGRRGRFDTPEQFQKAEKTVRDLQLDGLVVIGGDDATINAYLLDGYFREKEVNTCVIFCPNNLQNDGPQIMKYIPINKATPFCFGFDEVCEAYLTMIYKIKMDAQSRGDCYHFVRLSGYAASKITLVCALQTHPSIALIGDELNAKKLTFKDIRDQIVDVICTRSELGYNYGVILIPEGLIYFIPEIRKLFAELNKIFSVRPCIMDWVEKLTTQSSELFNVLPQKTRDAVRLRSNPRGFPLIPEIDTEWMLIEVVKTELEKKKNKGLYKGEFKGIPHYIGCPKPEYDWCYKLGYAAMEEIHYQRMHGLIIGVKHLVAHFDYGVVLNPPLNWLVDQKLRNGKWKTVIARPKVKLDGFRFKQFEAMRHDWAIEGFQ